MTFPVDFQFSQASLQDYVDCPKRFQLRRIQRLAWPALEAEPPLENERFLRQGAAFHRLIHQHLSAISPEQLSDTVTQDDLRRWWRNYLEEPPADLPTTRYPEVVLSAPLNGHRVIAKFDLVAIDAGRRAVIVDWKTSRRRPRRRWLAERLQTRVYPYLLVQAGSHLNQGQPLQPEQVSMVYWFANFPSDPERFAYDTAQYEADGVYLTSLIEEIKHLEEGDFPLTSQRRRCRHCPYRSLCQRGVKAGPFDEAEDEPELREDLDFELDFEQIPEIEYG